MSNKNKLYLVIFLLIFCAVLLYLFASAWNKERTSSLSKISEGSYLNWQTYSNDTLTFNYPSEYWVDEKDGVIMIIETPRGKSENSEYPYYPYTFYAYLSSFPNKNNHTPEEYFIKDLCKEGKSDDYVMGEWETQLYTGCVELYNRDKEIIKTSFTEGILSTYNPYEQGHPIYVFTRGDDLYTFHLGNTGETGYFPDENKQEIFKQIIESLEFRE